MFNTTAASVNLYQIFDAFYSSVVLLDSQRRIVCCNETFARLVGARRPQDLVAKDFYVTLDKPRFTDGDYCPLHFVATRGVQTRTFFVVPGPDGDENEERFYEMIATPFVSPSGDPQFLVAIQDVTETARDDRRLQRLSKTRAELYLLLDQAARQGLSLEKRMEKLMALVKKHMRATLRYDVYEMRLLEPDKKLIPFLSLGMQPDAQKRNLYASPSKNGISGYVASCGEPYICDDVKNDPYYIQGAIDAASSITLPILYLSDGGRGVNVLGVVNVESRSPNAFTRRDVRFLELYLSDLAQVLHRLKLLETETARVRAECAQELREDFFKASVNVVDAAFERCVQKCPQTEAEELETLGYARGVRDAAQRLNYPVKRLTSQWRGRSIAPPDDDEQFDELQYRRVLLVDRDVRFLESRVDAFEAY
ncbi:MAG: GAF domain-containing protein, partial [Thermoguttaceae bacterium]|nr:GAF domain-containing protein [Thermoguttaceae bacterium]MBQ9128037.1 GAF domain-containing protein [Thermoguttaceae bacterium]